MRVQSNISPAIKQLLTPRPGIPAEVYNVRPWQVASHKEKQPGIAMPDSGNTSDASPADSHVNRADPVDTYPVQPWQIDSWKEDDSTTNDGDTTTRPDPVDTYPVQPWQVDPWKEDDSTTNDGDATTHPESETPASHHPDASGNGAGQSTRKPVDSRTHAWFARTRSFLGHAGQLGQVGKVLGIVTGLVAVVPGIVMGLFSESGSRALVESATDLGSQVGHAITYPLLTPVGFVAAAAFKTLAAGPVMLMGKLVDLTTGRTGGNRAFRQGFSEIWTDLKKDAVTYGRNLKNRRFE